MLNFLHARHRDLYVRLALKYLKSPERSYHLAHGSNPKNEKEKKIRRELLDRGILPQDYEGRAVLLEQLNALAPALAKIQDKDTGAWYQVLDQGQREGNYLETSCTSMFAYTFLKAAKNGWLPAEYWETGMKALDGLNRNFIREDADGTISLTRVCGVAGLGGTPYRDGSFEYYVGEIIRDNDPKGVGPYIMASLLAEQGK